MSKIKVQPSVPTNIEVETIKDNYARLHVYPYEKGYAISIAHPLRRLLLSATVGYAPIAIKIEGVKHEFDSVRGMLEDVAEFIINLKNIRFKLTDSEADEAVVEYAFEGPKELRGSDLVTDTVEIVTPDNFLATLNEDANLRFTLIIKKGIGYVPSEEIRDELQEGFIALDAFFTPVKKAVYEIENVLVEDNPNYEKIVFDIETDGQIEPLEALNMAISVWKSQMAIFDSDLHAKGADAGDDVSKKEKIFFEPLDILNLSARSFNSLEKAGIKYVGELLLMEAKELKAIKNLGKKSLDEIEERLAELNVDVERLSDAERKAIMQKIQSLKDKE